MGMKYDDNTSLIAGMVHHIVEIARADKLGDETDEIF